jgi:hypothetical protein
MSHRGARITLICLITGVWVGVAASTAEADATPTPTASSATASPSATGSTTAAEAPGATASMSAAPTISASTSADTTPTPTASATADTAATPDVTTTPAPMPTATPSATPVTVDDSCLLANNPRCAGYTSPSASPEVRVLALRQSKALPHTGGSLDDAALAGSASLAGGITLIACGRRRRRLTAH